MRTWLTRFIAPIALVLSALIPAMIMAPPAGAVPPSISSLRTDGHTVVWIYSYYTSTLYAQTIGDSQARAIAENVGYSDVSGDRIVWQIYGRDRIASRRGEHLDRDRAESPRNRGPADSTVDFRKQAGLDQWGRQRCHPRGGGHVDGSVDGRPTVHCCHRTQRRERSRATGNLR